MSDMSDESALSDFTENPIFRNITPKLQPRIEKVRAVFNIKVISREFLLPILIHLRNKERVHYLFGVRKQSISGLFGLE